MDPADGAYYVSNIAGSFSDKDGNGYISEISPDGDTVIQKFIGGKKDEFLIPSAYLKNTHHTTAKIGIRIGKLNRKTYPKKLGVFARNCSAMDLTRKFGPLPM